MTTGANDKKAFSLCLTSNFLCSLNRPGKFTSLPRFAYRATQFLTSNTIPNDQPRPIMSHFEDNYSLRVNLTK